MFDPNDLHICLIGNNEQYNLYINLDIIRKNYSFGDKIWITSLYNGKKNDLQTGMGENNYIPLEYNRGYQLGAFDLFGEAIRMGRLVNRKYTIVMNFDVWILGEQALVDTMNEFIASEKFFMTGRDQKHNRPFCDIVIYNTQNMPNLNKNMVEDRLSEGECLEEWLYHSMCVSYIGEDFSYRENILDPYWHVMDRGDYPYLWSEKSKLLHTHHVSLKKKLLLENKITNGNFVKGFIK